MSEKFQQVGRIALRVEGDYWNAYYADEKTMQGAILLGSIKMSVVVRDDALKDAFMSLMRLTLSHVMEEVFGEKPTWKKPVPAPESERTKE